MRMPLLLAVVAVSIASFGQSEDKLTIRVSPSPVESRIASSAYVADYSGSEYMFDGIVLSKPTVVPPKLMFNCTVEVRRGESWEILKANYSGPQPSVMKVKRDGNGFPNVCRFVLPREGGTVGDCVRVVFRNNWFPRARTIRSQPFLIEANASTARSCSK